ncbi:hypothetical protein LZC95_46355 [Pendulispora brunnea]|uniref:Uncharacterized protein n=1 Tax=Pendulispora brunnea TaxID=2905690 RepID=A0ABZ2K589_9BACT
MRYGFGEVWLITDRFLRDWRFEIVPVGERTSKNLNSVLDSSEESLFHIIQFTFDDSRALCDETASDLLSIYDALTGTHLCEVLPRPTTDPHRRLRGFRAELSRVLDEALEAGVLNIERYEVPWPFPEPEEKLPSKPPPSPVEEKDTHDVLVHVPVTMDDAKKMPHVFVLESDDGSIRMKHPLASKARPLGEFACEIEFKDLKKSHQYRLSYLADGKPNVLFDYTPYDQLPHLIVPGSLEADHGEIAKMISAMHAADDAFDANTDSSHAAPSEPPPAHDGGTREGNA